MLGLGGKEWLVFVAQLAGFGLLGLVPLLYVSLWGAPILADCAVVLAMMAVGLVILVLTEKKGEKNASK